MQPVTIYHEFHHVLLAKIVRDFTNAECVSDDGANILCKPSLAHNQKPPSHPSGGIIEFDLYYSSSFRFRAIILKAPQTQKNSTTHQRYQTPKTKRNDNYGCDYYSQPRRIAHVLTS